jgi:hypothetical protein
MTNFNETGDHALAADASQRRTRQRMRAAAVVAAACILSGGLGAGLASAFENGTPSAAAAPVTHAVIRSMPMTATIDTQKNRRDG